MRYTYRIIYRDSGKPYTVPSGVYEMPPEEVILDQNKALEFIKNRPELTIDLAFDEVKLQPFNPELTNVFIERPAHTMKVGDLFLVNVDGADWICEATEIGELVNNVFKVLCHDSSVYRFAVNEKVLFLEEFEISFKLTYTKKIPSHDLSKIEEINVTTWSPSKEIHEQRIVRLKENKNWKISNLKESTYLMKKISEREI